MFKRLTLFAILPFTLLGVIRMLSKAFALVSPTLNSRACAYLKSVADDARK